MKDIKIVIGANWGDEGKGLMTDYFSQKPNTIVVCSNGGAQRGHTVEHQIQSDMSFVISDLVRLMEQVHIYQKTLFATLLFLGRSMKN